MQKPKTESSTFKGMGAVSLYQLYETYAPDGPLLSEVQSFQSGNHTGADAISFCLHGYNCVYTSRVVDFSANGYVGLASMFVCGSSNTAYYRNICDVYLNASSWLLNNAANYPALSFYSFEQDSATQWMRSTLLERQACYQAALNQIANATMGAAINSSWYKSKNGGTDWNWTSWYSKIVRPSFCSPAYSSLCDEALGFLCNFCKIFFLKTTMPHTMIIMIIIQGHQTKSALHMFVSVAKTMLDSVPIDSFPSTKTPVCSSQ